MNDRFKFRGWFNNSMLGEVTPYSSKEVVVMQCTGLKDKNGKLIYEGDIINPFPESGAGELPAHWLQVVWSDFGFNFKRLNGKSTFHLLLKDGEYEITGNIYENPELLTK